MTRFFFIVFAIIFLGTAMLMLIAPEFVGRFLFFVVGLGVISFALKISLDFLLHFRKSDDELEALSMTGRRKPKTFFSIEEYTKQLKKRRTKRANNSR